MKVALAQAAMADLIAIGRYIANDSPARAETFVDELEQKCLELASMLRAFPLVPNRRNKDVRRRVHGNYLIFYRVGPDQIDILHVLHGRGTMSLGSSTSADAPRCGVC
jgi:plasmid stabilization system protein ParE